MNFVGLLLIGIVIGMANVIPGVSGGTLAVVFGIYEKFVSAITFNVKKLAKNWKFLVPLLSGMACGILLFSKLITVLYEHFPDQTNCLFTGLILGSIPMIVKLMTKKNSPDEKVNASRIITTVICIIAGLALILTFYILEKKINGNTPLLFELPQITAGLEVKIFIAGFLGSIAMIIPGISGSLLMLIMGVYPIVMKAIPSLFSTQTFLHALFLLLPNGIGVLLGLVCGAKLIAFLLNRFPNSTYAVIFGLLAGSAFTVFPGFACFSSVVKSIACVLCILVGAAMAYFSAKLSPEDKEKTSQ